MTDGGIHQISEAIGSLRAEVQTLTRAVRENETRASSHRKEIRKEISDLTQTMAPICQDVADMKPIVAGVVVRRHQTTGALIVIRAAYVGAAGLVGAFLGLVAKKFGISL